ncbi:RagB/SusD family nutrient uptake outer membrane protein, partial [Butyricimonas paravirosa]
SCDSFLEYKDKDQVIPSTLEHYNELIYGELITKSSSSVCYNLHFLTDDIGDQVPSGYSEGDDRENYLSWYTWAREPQISKKGDETIDPAWEFFYHQILMCNIIEEDVKALEEDTEGVKYRLLGEVQCIRGMAYFYLVNMYGAPYENADQAKNAMGVPINKEISILDKIYVRERLQTVYDLIEEDLKSALDNFNKGEVKNTIFRPNKDVARLFLSRAYLFQKKYDKVITVCDDMIKETVKMIVPLEEMKTYTEYSSGVPLYNKNSHSLLYTCWARDAMSGFNSGYWYGKYAISDDLKKQYGVNDVRPKVFFDYYGVKPIKYTDYGGCYGMCYRIEEIYFNRAEAYIESGDYELGMKDVNRIYSQRIDDVNVSLSASDVENARKLFRQEKRRELCFETIRWFDIRRWGLAVEHDYKDINDPSMYQTYVLEANSPNYILPLPLDIQRRNDKIEKPERVEAKLKN